MLENYAEGVPSALQSDQGVLTKHPYVTSRHWELVALDGSFQCEGAVVLVCTPFRCLSFLTALWSKLISVTYICDLSLLALLKLPLCRPTTHKGQQHPWHAADATARDAISSSFFFQCHITASLFWTLCGYVNCLPVSWGAHSGCLFSFISFFWSMPSVHEHGEGRNTISWWTETFGLRSPLHHMSLVPRSTGLTADANLYTRRRFCFDWDLALKDVNTHKPCIIYHFANTKQKASLKTSTVNFK